LTVFGWTLCEAARLSLFACWAKFFEVAASWAAFLSAAFLAFSAASSAFFFCCLTFFFSPSIRFLLASFSLLSFLLALITLL
jgi:hypothetical protein